MHERTRLANIVISSKMGQPTKHRCCIILFAIFKALEPFFTEITDLVEVNSLPATKIALYYSLNVVFPNLLAKNNLTTKIPATQILCSVQTSTSLVHQSNADTLDLFNSKVS